MKTVDAVVGIVNAAVEISKIVADVFYQFRVTGFFTGDEERYIAERILLWLADCDDALQRIVVMLKESGSFEVPEIRTFAISALFFIKRNLDAAQQFDARFRKFCISNMSSGKDDRSVVDLFAGGPSDEHGRR